MNIEQFDSKKLTLIYLTNTHNQVLKSRVEAELNNRFINNKKYSIEYFYSVCNIGKKALTIYFFPMSNSYLKFGEKLVVDTMFSDDEIQAIHVNYLTKSTRTFGIIKLRIMNREGLTSEQVKELSTVGIDVKDVCFAEF